MMIHYDQVYSNFTLILGVPKMNQETQTFLFTKKKLAF